MPTVVLLSLAALLLLMGRTRIRPAFLFSGLLLSYYALGWINAPDMLRHFSNPSLATLLLLLLTVSALGKTAIIGWLARVFFDSSSRRWVYLRILSFSALLSTILHNTAVIVALLGPAKSNRQVPPKKLLIPLSYAVTLGGTVTLIGTSTNMIANGMLLAAGQPQLGIFDFAFVGLPLMICGVLYLSFFGHRLLAGPIPAEAAAAERYFLEARVLPGSRLIGKTILANRLRHLKSMFLAEIIRGNGLISPVSPQETIQQDDVLVFTGEIADFKDLERFPGLKIFEDGTAVLRENLAETVVAHSSDLVGRKICEVNFRSQFDAAVVAVRRGHKQLSGKIGLIALEPGDILVMATGRDFPRAENVADHFYLVKPLAVEPRLSGWRNIAAPGIFLLALTLSTMGVLSLFSALLAVLALYVLGGILEAAELKQHFNFDLLLLVGSALGISQVVVESGAGAALAQIFHSAFGGMGVTGQFAGIFLLTVILTQFVTNNAAVALAFPFAFSLAQNLGVNAMPFVMAVTYGASASFLTPQGYQTNLLVYSAGNYKLSDYFKVGLPLILIYSLLVLFLVPRFFPY